MPDDAGCMCPTNDLVISIISCDVQIACAVLVGREAADSAIASMNGVTLSESAKPLQVSQLYATMISLRIVCIMCILEYEHGGYA